MVVRQLCHTTHSVSSADDDDDDYDDDGSSGFVILPLFSFIISQSFIDGYLRVTYW